MSQVFGTPTYAGGSGTSAVLGKPSDLADGDVLLIALRSQESASPTNWTLPVGFVQITAPVLGGGVSGKRVGGVWAKVIEDASSEPSTYAATGPSGRYAGGAVAWKSPSPGELSSLGMGVYGGNATVSGITTLNARSNMKAPAVSFVALGAECTAGISHVPDQIPSGYVTVLNGQSSLDASTAGSRTAVWLGYTELAVTSLPSISGGHTGSSAGALYEGSVEGGGSAPPPVTGFTVSDMLAADGITWAHRGGSANWPEMSDYAYEHAVATGYKVLEFSCGVTSDNVWIGLHDNNLNRTSGLSGMPAINTMTWAEVQAYQITIGAAGAPQPYMKLEDFIEKYRSTHLLVLDPKNYDYGSYRSAFLSYVTNLGPEKVIVKIYGPSASDLPEVVAGMGYTTWGYNLEEIWNAVDFAARAGRFALLGLEISASNDAWSALLGLGKPIIAHIAQSQAEYDTAVQKGALGTQTGNVLAVRAMPSDTPDPSTYAGMSNRDLEISWLRRESGITAAASLSDLRRAVYTPSEYAYWAARSGLTVGSLADHKLAAMQAGIEVSTGSLTDVSRAFWAKDL